MLALNCLHKKGLTHRDLKPENLTFERKTTGKNAFVRLIDFGLALDLNNEQLGSSEALIFVGTPYYMAPEVINKETLCEQSDMWSLGVTMYTMLCGYPPFVKAQSQEELFDLINTCNYEYRD